MPLAAITASSPAAGPCPRLQTVASNEPSGRAPSHRCRICQTTTSAPPNGAVVLSAPVVPGPEVVVPSTEVLGPAVVGPVAKTLPSPPPQVASSIDRATNVTARRTAYLLVASLRDREGGS